MAKSNKDTDDFETFEAVPIEKISRREEQSPDDYDNAALHDLILSLGSASDVTVTVSHAGRHGKYEIIETYSVDELTSETIDALRAQYGAGLYRFRAKRVGGSRPLWQKDCRFAERPLSQRSAPTAPPPSDNTLHSALVPLLQAVQQQGKMLEALLHGMQHSRGKPDDDLDRLIRLKALLDAGQKQTDPFEIFMKSVAITKDLIQPSEGSNSIDLIRDVVKGMTAYAPQRQLVAAPQQPVLQGPPQPPQPQTPAPKEEYKMPELADFAKIIYGRAATGEAPDAFARTMVDYVGPDAIADFIELHNEPGKTFTQRFIEFDPELGAKYANWINVFCAEIERLVFE